ncbi:MAG: PIN domain-containing protein [archaeon]|nr:PIN domain-containing protein [archaeon]
MYIDADILFAFLKPADRHLEFAKKIVGSKEKLYTSTVTILELELVVKRELNDFLARDILAAVLKNTPKLQIIEFDRKTLQKSLELQQQYSLGIFDSVHAAAALSKDKKIASTDHIFDRITGLKRTGPEQD